MRDIYKYSSTRSWKEYYAEKATGFPYSGSAALRLNDGCLGRPRNSKFDVPGANFFPYWTALELIHEGKANSLNMTLPEVLAACKKNYQKEVEREKAWAVKPETYGGYPLNWELFRPYDQDFNDFDRVTAKCVIPIRLSDEEVKGLKEDLYEPFVDPYCDGRDCTGAWFTGYIKVLRCADRTYIIHCKHCDV